MENLSEYIPLLIILVSIIFTVIGKKKKQGRITQETTLPGQTTGEFIDESNSPQPFTDFFQNFIEEKPNKETHNKPEIKQVKRTVPFSSAPEIFESEEEENSPFSFKEEDDVMRAIVYSEIIKKKEY